MITSPTPKPSRSLWPMAIATYFIVAIIGIVIFVTWAVRQNVDLVRKDYYAEELQFQRHLDQVQHTRELDGKNQIEFDRVRDVVAVLLPSSKQSPTSGHIQFYRPSDSSQDRNIKLSLNSDGAQQIDTRALQNGLWKVRVTWLADGKEFFSEQTIVIDRSHS